MTATSPSNFSRRHVLVKSISALIVGSMLHNNARATKSGDRKTAQENFAGAMGIVSAGAHAQITGRAKGKSFTLLEIPKVLHEELDMTVLDLNTTSFPDFNKVNATYLERLRNAVDKFGCVMTNLKMNQRGFDMNSADRDVRRRALNEYKRSIDVAAELGCRWVRPLPQKVVPDKSIHIASYQELCAYGAKMNVQLLVENFGWMQGDPNAVPDLIKAIGHNVAACPDTGNWNSNDVRYAGLARAFPLAVTCDFKAKKLGLNNEHPAYDMKRCFNIAWDAGFRGPWAIEHGNTDTDGFMKGIAFVRDSLRKWTADKLAAAER